MNIRKQAPSGGATPPEPEKGNQRPPSPEPKGMEEADPVKPKFKAPKNAKPNSKPKPKAPAVKSSPPEKPGQPRKVLTICAVLVLAFVLPPLIMFAVRGIVGTEWMSTSSSEPSSSEEEESEPEPEEPPPPEDSTVRLLAVGDDLIHDVLYHQAQRRAGGSGYDFLPIYERVQGRIEAADIAFINQETVMDGSRPPSNYPRFNTPPELAPQLAEVGFDVMNLANNHMFDQEASGLLATIDVIDEVPGLTRIGAFRDKEEQQDVSYIEKNGITFAFAGYTELTNLGGGGSAREHMIYTRDTDVVTEQLTRARENADVVVVSLHAGTENTNKVNAEQVQIANFLAGLGVDIIIGHHPHVIQPIERLTSEDGHETLVYYSLGNFVSAQDIRTNLLGLMTEVEVTKSGEDGTISIGTPTAWPVVTHYGARMSELSLYPLEDYTEELAASHGVQAYGSKMSVDFLNELLSETIDAKYLPGASAESFEEEPSGEEESVEALEEE